MENLAILNEFNTLLNNILSDSEFTEMKILLIINHLKSRKNKDQIVKWKNFINTLTIQTQFPIYDRKKIITQFNQLSEDDLFLENIHELHQSLCR